ncbi:MAG: helix-turn-helix transcriptional regulator [Lentisphaerae bacterium]|nr:helix-turn-helix transcriptional regulator [Lentisphaerota bacterium]
MAILSKRILADVRHEYHRRFGLRPRLMDFAGRTGGAADPLDALAGVRRRRDYALQQSIGEGRAFVYEAAPGVAAWVLGLEDRRMVHGGLLAGEVRAGADGEAPACLARMGMGRREAERFVARLPRWPAQRVTEAADALYEVFYAVSGWTPALLRENRLRVMQERQIQEAAEDQRRRGGQALYAFEKERMLLANIRAGDRNGARRILNDMLAAIYLSSPKLVVLRARAVELMSCLTRAAIEDNQLLEPLIDRNHAWTERLVHAGSFEDLSVQLMDALDEFIDGIYLHGMNRSNEKVRAALDLIGRGYAGRISLRTVAAGVGLSPVRLSHLVKALTGRTVGQVIREVRVRHAQQMLERTSRSCAEIGYEAGFGDQSYFIKHFKRLTGVTPARYRRRLQAP